MGWGYGAVEETANPLVLTGAGGDVMSLDQIKGKGKIKKNNNSKALGM